MVQSTAPKKNGKSDNRTAWRAKRAAGLGQFRGRFSPARTPQAEAVEVKVDNRGGVQRQHLAENQAADDGDAKWAAEFKAFARAEGERQAAEQGRHGRHRDGAEP